MLIPVVAARGRQIQLADSRFRAHNVVGEFDEPENVTEYCSLTAPPNSRITRRPLLQDENSVPMILTKLTNTFILAEVTISADFEMDWDQGGLIIFTGNTPAQRSSVPFNRHRAPLAGQRQTVTSTSKWAKVGLEFTGGELGVSTVIANPDCGADSSFTPAFPSLSPREAFSVSMPSLRVKLERVGDDLWIWYRIPDDPPVVLSARSPGLMSRNWKKCREVSGFFDGISIKSGVHVGCYASRPMDLEDATDEDGLFVEFEDLEIM